MHISHTHINSTPCLPMVRLGNPVTVRPSQSFNKFLHAMICFSKFRRIIRHQFTSLVVSSPKIMALLALLLPVYEHACNSVEKSSGVNRFPRCDNSQTLLDTHETYTYTNFPFMSGHSLEFCMFKNLPDIFKLRDLLLAILTFVWERDGNSNKKKDRMSKTVKV